MRKSKTQLFLDSISSEDLISLYEKHSAEYISKQYNTSKYIIVNALEILGAPIHSRQQETRYTCLEKYGVDNPSKSDDVKRRIKQSKEFRYGDPNYNNKEKIKETCIERYGTPSASGNVEVQGKIKKTCQERYGVDNPFQRVDLVQDGFIKNYGSISAAYEHIAKSQKNNLIERYGVLNVSQLPGSREKAIESMKHTCLNKYGVEFPTLLPQCQFSKGNSSLSTPNQEFGILLSSNNIEFSRERTLINRSFDFDITGTDILVEINPSATHNSTWSPFGVENIKSATYHRDKSRLAFQNGYRCIHVWDWDDKEKILSLLRPQEKVYARKCTIKELKKEETKDFLNLYHLQGYISSDIAIGLFYDDELISLMTFGKPRYTDKYEYELIRYCSCKSVIGGAEKLFNYFLKSYSPESVVSYCDMSKFSGHVYQKLNMTLESINISKHWYNIESKQHILDSSLNKVGFDNLFHTNYGKGTSNRELMLSHGFVEIYDAGQAKYVFYS